MKAENDDREEEVVVFETAAVDLENEVEKGANIEGEEVAIEIGDEAPASTEEPNSKKVHMKVAADAPWSARMWEVFTTFWPLGLVAFGGPQVRTHGNSMVWYPFSSSRSSNLCFG